MIHNVRYIELYSEIWKLELKTGLRCGAYRIPQCFLIGFLHASPGAPLHNVNFEQSFHICILTCSIICTCSTSNSRDNIPVFHSNYRDFSGKSAGFFPIFWTFPIFFVGFVTKFSWDVVILWVFFGFVAILWFILNFVFISVEFLDWGLDFSNFLWSALGFTTFISERYIVLNG